LIFLKIEGLFVLLNRLLGLREEESVLLAEVSLQDLLYLNATSEILEEGLDAQDCIEIKGIGAALLMAEPREFWLLLTDRYSDNKILQDSIDYWRRKRCRTIEVNENDFFLAIAEYFSQSMSSELFCDSCSVDGAPLHIPERISRLEGFLQGKIPPKKSILEIGCGNGMATQALLRLGYSPLSMDSDRCELCQSLRYGLMDPKRCFVLDARLLPRFFQPKSFDTVMGFMVGLIERSNWPYWKEILIKASTLAKEEILFTVYAQKEAEIIAKAFDEAFWRGEVIDLSDFRGIYDQWAYHAQREN
jgi:SAM-dependent methyltransferase